MTAPDPVLQAVARHCSQAQAPLTLALSGGLDSVVLLDALRELALPCRAVHVHHGLQPEADHWQHWCQQLCAGWGISLQVHRVQVDLARRPGQSPPSGLEAAARTARYGIFAQVLEQGGTLVLAQHRDDQAETLLLQLLRGAGARGLAAMPLRRRLAAGQLLRPLLDVPQQALVQRAAQRGLSWQQDPSNSNPTFRRNALRHQVLPLLEQVQPGAGASLARSARVLAGQAQVEQDAGALALAAVFDPVTAGLDLARYRQLPASLQPLLLRAWARAVLQHPDAAGLVLGQHLLQRLQQVLADQGRTDTRRHQAVAVGVPGAVQAVVWRDSCVLLRANPAADVRWAKMPAAWCPRAGGLDLPWGQLRVTEALAVDRSPARSFETRLALAALPAGGFSMRRRAGGERMQPGWRNHSASLKQLCQEAGLPPWMRDDLPLLYLHGQLVAVPGVGAVAELQPAPGAAAVQLQWHNKRLLQPLFTAESGLPPIVGQGVI